MAKRCGMALVLATLVLLMVPSHAQAFGPCHHDPFVWCGVQCTFIAGGFYCYDPSNPTRGCWDSYPSGGACGEDADYEGCHCGTGMAGGF